MTEPSASSRSTAFGILTGHSDCLRDDVVLNELIDDIATAIDGGAINKLRAWLGGFKYRNDEITVGQVLRIIGDDPAIAINQSSLSQETKP